MMEQAQAVYDTIDYRSGSMLVRMIAAQFITERAIFSPTEGGPHSLRTDRGYALEPLREENHMDMMGLSEHAWRVLRSDRKFLRNLVPSINRCMAACAGNESLRETVRMRWL